MPRPTRIRKQLAVTLELLVDVECEICPAEPDVGISTEYVSDDGLTIHAIGTEKNEPENAPDWCKGFNSDCPGLEQWLTSCIIEQCGDRLEEQLMDDNY